MYNALLESDFWMHLSPVASLLYTGFVILTLVFLVLKNRPPQHTLAWGLTIIFIPFLGLFLYLLLGLGYRKRRKYKRKAARDRVRVTGIKLSVDLGFDPNPLIHLLQGHPKLHLMKLLIRNSRSLLTRHNAVSVLQNGDQAFPALFSTLKKAEHHIHLEYYIMADDPLGRELLDILLEKAESGVKVRLIYDGYGSLELSRAYLHSLRAAGVELAVFGPVRFPILAHNLNYRNHRKIAVVDGKYGFTGGMNISERYRTGTKDLGAWRDTHLCIEGEAVHGLQAIFATDWQYLDGGDLWSDTYFPIHRPADQFHLIQITPSGPDTDLEEIFQAYFSAIATATQRVFISTPYFLPDDSLMMALTTAAMSGVDVRMLLPGQSDVPVIRYATMGYIETLLQSGVRIFIYKKGFNHQKVLTVDGEFSSIGTANMDIRSFRKNFEVNAFLYDNAIARELEDAFLEDLDGSEELLLQAHLRRSRRQKLMESLARLISPAF